MGLGLVSMTLKIRVKLTQEDVYGFILFLQHFSSVALSQTFGPLYKKNNSYVEKNNYVKNNQINKTTTMYLSHNLSLKKYLLKISCN